MFNSNSSPVSYCAALVNASPPSRRVRHRWAAAKIKRMPLPFRYNLQDGQFIFDCDYMHDAFDKALVDMICAEAKKKASIESENRTVVRQPEYLIVAKYARVHWTNAVIHYREQTGSWPSNGELRSVMNEVVKLGRYPKGIQKGLEYEATRMNKRYPDVRRKVDTDEIERFIRSKKIATPIAMRGALL